MDISVIIPTFNGQELLKQNLPKVIDALEDYKNGAVEIIITDDASRDESVDIAQKILEKNSSQQRHFLYKVLQNTSGKNKGFAGNVNVGVRAATGDIIILLNSDVIPEKGFLSPLLSHFSNESVFAVGCMDESVESGRIVLRGRGIGKWERGFLHHTAGSLDASSTLWVSGGSGAFRKSHWDKLGGLNELYNPFYWEDIDISYRAQKAGYTIVFEKNSIVRHEHSKGTIKTFYKPLKVKQIAYRNQFLFTWLNLTDTMLIVAHLFWLPYHFAKAIQQRDLAFFYGFFAALIKVPKVLIYRMKVQSLWKRTDKEVVALSY